MVNIDGALVSDLFDANKVNTKNASVQVNSVEFAKDTGAFFDDEKTIKKAENLNDAYDRIGSKANIDNPGEMAVTPETIKNISDVVTPENYSKYEELGIEPDKDEPGSILTVAERIEIELAANCEDYKPIGNISADDLEKMYGSRAYEVKETLDKANSLTSVSKEASAYLLTNDMDLTIDNVYMAEHSVSGTDYEKYQELTDTEWQELKPQIEKILRENGFDVNESNVNNGKWLVESKIPVTTENIYKLSEIDEINRSIEEGIGDNEWLRNISLSISYGMTAGETSANYYSTIKSDSVEAVEIVKNGTEEQVTALVMDGKNVTLLNMKRIEEDNTHKSIEERSEKATKEQKKKIISEWKNLEELRLKMTVEASATMIKNGINVEISALSDLVDELKQMEKTYAETIFDTENLNASTENIDLFTETNSYMKAFAETPVYILGDVLDGTVEFETYDVTVQGTLKADVLKSMQISYDTLGTKPDRELGDSIKKAFTGIDSMLEDLNIDDTLENQRAVRILAYNEMEITKENIASIVEMDTQVTRLIENMTPRTTAYLISNGINPLKTNIGELNDKLDEINKEIGGDEVEKYSEFLWKLDKNKEMSKEDREAYIGIYRLINMVEKGDRKSIGAIAKQGADLTMKNLLTAVRSMKHTKKEAVIDNEFGTLESVNRPENNIDNQLMQFESSVFAKRAKDILSPEIIKEAIKDNGDMTLDEFIENVNNSNQDTAEETAYFNELKSKEIQNLNVVSEEVLENIYQDGNNATMNNLMSIAYFMANRGNSYVKVKNICEDNEVSENLYDLEKSIEGEEGVEELKEKVNKVSISIKEALLDKSQINVEDLRKVSRMADYINRAADNNSYYVPATINNKSSLIKVTIDTKSEDKGKVAISINDNESVINAEFILSHGEVKGIVLSNEEMVGKLEKLGEKLDENLRKIGLNLKTISVTDNSYKMPERREDNIENSSTNTLFNVAKVYISSVKNCLG